LRLANGYDQPLLMREDDRIEVIVCHDLHDALPQFGALLEAQPITVILLGALCFSDVISEIGMKLANALIGYDPENRPVAYTVRE
jgi:hypothetical protein